MTTPTDRRRTRLFALALILGASFSMTVIASQSGDADTRYYTANGLLNRGLYDMAAPEYQAFLSAEPDSEFATMARYGLAVCLYRLERHEEALAQLDLLSNVPSFEYAGDADLIAGHCLMRLARYKEAGKVLRAMIRQHPDHPRVPDASVLRVEALHRAGSHSATTRAAEKASELELSDPQRDRIDLFWGLSAAASGDDAIAAERFKTIVDRNGDNEISAQAVLLLAQSKHRLGQREAALSYYAQVLDRDLPGKPDALLGSAQLFYETNQIDNATKQLDLLLSEYASTLAAQHGRLLRGRIALDSNAVDEARELLETVASGDETDLIDDAAYWLAKERLRSGEPAEAAQMLRDALDAYGDSPLAGEMAFDYAVALSRSGEAELALKAFASFLKANKNSKLAPDAILAQANIAHSLNKYEDSLEHVTRFIASHPEHAGIVSAELLRAENLYLLGRTKEAEPMYRAWLSEHGDANDAALATFRLGMCLYRRGNFDHAEPLLIASAKLAEGSSVYHPALLALGDGRFQAERWADAEDPLERYTKTKDAPNRDDALLKLGLARSRQGDFQNALDPLQALLKSYKKSPHRPHAMFALARSLNEIGEHDKAAMWNEQLVEDAPDSRFAPHAMRQLGAAAQSAGDNTGAAEWYARAANAGAGEVSAEAGLDQGRALLASARYKDAAEVLRPIASGEDQGLAIRAGASLTIALSRAEDDAGAIAAFEGLSKSNIQELSASLADAATYAYARSLNRSGQKDDAAGYFDVLSRNAEDKDLRSHCQLERAAIAMDQGDYESARNSLRPLLDSLDSESDRALSEQAIYRAGVCAFQLEDNEDVAELLQQFHANFPDSATGPSADLMCGQSLIALGRNSSAIEHLERASSEDVDPETSEPALLRLGEALATLQFWPRSEAAFAEHLNRFPDSELWFQSRFGLAWAKENQDRPDEAILDYSKVIESHSGETSARAQFQVGECLYAKDDLEAAVKAFLMVDILHAYPEWSASALYEAGRCFEKMGRFAEARKQYIEVGERFAASEWSKLASERLKQMVPATPPGRG